ncbi:MAG TPA: DoxX family protein [Candidatus Angelobacter sp.]|nr:DoxX family protein [Candidatus Angelobacter sp.]
MSNGNSSSSGNDLALLLMRVACALPVLYHGGQILFGSFAGPGPQGFANYQHLPVAYGYLVGLAQVGGGIAILTGAFMRTGTLCIIIVMLGAIFRVHMHRGFNIANGGIEFALTVLLLALGLSLSGPGAYSFRSLLPGPLKNL